MATGKRYNFNRVALVVAGLVISGFADDGQIEIEFAPVGEKLVGADGEAVVSYNNDESANMTITLMETSLAYRRLMELYQNDRAAGFITDHPISMVDLVNGDTISDLQILWLEIPSPSKGATAGTRAFVICLPSGRANFKAGTKITR